MSEAPHRERAALARTAISMKMDGQKKTATFGLLRKGEQISVSVLLNTLTKFSKLTVGKHVVSAKQRHSTGSQLFPLVIALSGLNPLMKLSVDYEPQPKNIFQFRVNDADIYSLVKEEVNYDPSKIESLIVDLAINENLELIISGLMPWIVDDVEE